ADEAAFAAGRVVAPGGLAPREMGRAAYLSKRTRSPDRWALLLTRIAGQAGALRARLQLLEDRRRSRRDGEGPCRERGGPHHRVGRILQHGMQREACRA